MGLRGVNRIMIAVRDLEQGKALYRDMLGATFEDAHWTGEPFGILVSIAWDAGIEICAPMPGREVDSAVSAFLAHRGEGIITVFFGVDDSETAVARAARAGFASVHALDYTQDEIDTHLSGYFTRYQENMLDSAERCGFTVALARLDPRPASAG